MLTWDLCLGINLAVACGLCHSFELGETHEADVQCRSVPFFWPGHTLNGRLPGGTILVEGDIEDEPPERIASARSSCIGCGATIVPGEPVRDYEEGPVHAHGCGSWH